MRKLFVFGTALALAVFLITGTNAEDPKPVPKGKTRPAETKYLMSGVVSPNCGGLGKSFGKDGKAPADDKAWDQVTAQASLLNEMSYVLMDDDRCPGKEWKEACATLGEGSAKLLGAAKAKNADDAQAAFKTVTASCGACHSVYKPKKK